MITAVKRAHGRELGGDSGQLGEEVCCTEINRDNKKVFQETDFCSSPKVKGPLSQGRGRAHSPVQSG